MPFIHIKSKYSTPIGGTLLKFYKINVIHLHITPSSRLPCRLLNQATTKKNHRKCRTADTSSAGSVCPPQKTYSLCVCFICPFPFVNVCSVLSQTRTNTTAPLLYIAMRMANIRAQKQQRQRLQPLPQYTLYSGIHFAHAPRIARTPR